MGTLFTEKHYNRVLAGIPTVIVCIALIGGPSPAIVGSNTGGLFDALMSAVFLLVAITFCTAGIALVGLIPVFYIAGYVFLSALELGMHATGLSKRMSAPSIAHSPHVTLAYSAPLVKYIVQGKVKGLDDQQIRSLLAAAGWSGEEIRNAQDAYLKQLRAG